MRIVTSGLMQVEEAEAGEADASGRRASPPCRRRSCSTGSSGEVTVAESPTTRDSMTGARPRRGELGAEHPARQHDGDVLVGGHDVGADAGADHRATRGRRRDLRALRSADRSAG